MIKSQDTGFTIKFSNGVTASVQFGPFNYCENRHKGDARFCVNAEVSAWGEDEIMIRHPEGWKSPEDVLGFLNEMAALPHIDAERSPQATPLTEAEFQAWVEWENDMKWEEYLDTIDPPEWDGDLD